MKVKKVIVMILILIVVISTLAVAILWRGYNSDYAITYKEKGDRVIFELVYNNNYYNQVSANIDDETVIMEDKEQSEDEINVLNQLGLIRKRKIVSYKLNRNGMAKVTFSFSGRYEDTVSLATYKIEVTDTGVTITDMKL